MALTRTHCRAAVGRAGGPNPDLKFRETENRPWRWPAATSSPAKLVEGGVPKEGSAGNSNVELLGPKPAG